MSDATTLNGALMSGVVAIDLLHTGTAQSFLRIRKQLYRVWLKITHGLGPYLSLRITNPFPNFLKFRSKNRGFATI